MNRINWTPVKYPTKGNKAWKKAKLKGINNLIVQEKREQFNPQLTEAAYESKLNAIAIPIMLKISISHAKLKNLQNNSLFLAIVFKIIVN